MIALIYSGVPGSGKSYLAQEAVRHPDVLEYLTPVFEADDFFTDADGNYHWDPHMIGEAHGQCLRRFTTACQNQDPLVVTANTNTTIEEIAPYYSIAEAYGYDVEIRRVRVTLDQAQVCCQHGVSDQHVSEMARRMAFSASIMPKRWNIEDVPNTDWYIEELRGAAKS